MSGSLLGAGVILLAGYAAGAALLRPTGLVLDGRRRKLLFRTGLGLAAVAYVVLVVGLIGRLSPAAGWLVVILALAAGGPALLAEQRVRGRMRQRTADTPVAFRREEVAEHWWSGGAWPRWATLVAVTVLALLAGAAVVVAVAPPAAWDDLTYHLAAPKIFARTGRVVILPYDHHTAFPFTLEMLYTLALLIGDAGAARLIQTGYWALTLLAVWTLAAEHLGRRAGWLATLIYAATPLAYFESGTAYTEFGFALYQLLAWLALAEYLNLRRTAVRFSGAAPAPLPRQPRWLPLAGAMAGLTYGTKYTGVLVVAWLAGAVAVLGWRDRLGRRAVRVDLTVLALAAGLVAAPWILRTWVTCGNPVFPFADGLFHSPKWSADRAAAYDAAQKEFGQRFSYRDGRLAIDEPTPTSHRSPGRLVTAPWNLTFSPDWFYDRGLNFDGKARLGPGYLALVPAALLFWLLLAARLSAAPPIPYQEVREETVRQVYRPEFGREVPVPTTHGITERVQLDSARLIALLLAHLVGFGLLWFWTMQYARYLVPHLALWAILAGWGADGLLRAPISAVAATLAVAGQVAGGLAYAKVAAYPALRVRLGGLTAEQYAAAPLPAYGAMQWLNQHTAPETRVILYGEPRGYWLDRDYLWGERNHHTMIPDSARSSMAVYLDFLGGELGVTHALVNESIFPTDRAEGQDDIALVTQAIRAGRLREVWRDPRRPVVVYELADRKPNAGGEPARAGEEP